MNEHKRIERLILFVELAQQLNFTKAAEKLGISKSYLSEQIKRLESDLQCPLLVRTTRSVRLTQEGERALQQGLTIRSQVLQLERSVSEQHDIVKGTLRLTAPKMFTEVFLFDICQQFKEQYPEVRFEINSSYTNFNLNQDDIDIAFRATNTPPENMIAKRLIAYQHDLVATPNYLKRFGRPSNTNELKHHQCLATLHQTEWPLRSANIEVSGWLSSNDNHLLKQQAMKGSGIIRIASYYVEKEIERGELERVLTNECLQQDNCIYLFYPQVIYPAKKHQMFIKFVQDYFDNLSKGSK
ncbi:LysR family transcriptional regulator [Vibrio lentus]|uniref:LysR family transcriptional regulator n=1 Tax=Vibrio lentus TaxID=136468 RepID=A0A855IRB7_9VIBR|nr:LysR family transcriptional regulator [Vibrio lentus]PMJ60392.1 LysR family transcriptional regulator [Vibrio lentus]PMJ86317.1 LysR family transcriptional regulator [Vibrio lentus]PMM53941.1 LysR family transcriptional regulator [Vibrio lentus]PMM59010.1 LysR family transcriptional regulator [Vibrio lentus]PMN35948.1 LysR family transcriptional regulator [Vibrio lentus]